MLLRVSAFCGLLCPPRGADLWLAILYMFGLCELYVCYEVLWDWSNLEVLFKPMSFGDQLVAHVRHAISMPSTLRGLYIYICTYQLFVLIPILRYCEEPGLMGDGLL